MFFANGSKTSAWSKNSFLSSQPCVSFLLVLLLSATVSVPFSFPFLPSQDDSVDKNSVDKKPEARQGKILLLSKQKKEFTIQDVLKVLSNVPRRTVQRDLEDLVSLKKIKAKGDRKARVYSR